MEGKMFKKTLFNLMLSLLGWTFLAMGSSKDCLILEKDGKIIAENQFFSLLFEPKNGGSITSFLYHGKNLTMKVPGEGILQDLFWEEMSEREFQKKEYKYEILKREPEEVILHLWARGSQGSKQFIEFHKTISIFKDKSIIRVEYEIKNLPHSMTSLTYSPWSHNILGVVGEENTYYFPTTEGIKKVKHNKEKPQGNYWVNNPSRAWSAVISDKGTGVVGICDFRYLKNLYNWFGKDFVTVEWMYGPVTIPCGESFKTTYYFFPFSGLSSIEGATKDIVGTIIPFKDRINLKVVASRSLKATILLRYKILPSEKWQKIKEEKISLLPDKTISLIFPFSFTKQGTYVFNALVKENNQEIGEIETPYVKGKSSGNYTLLPKEKKLFKKEVNYVPFIPTKKVVTPHINWSIPYSKGKVKGLFLVAVTQEREIVELAQRIDLDFVTSTIAFHHYPIGWYPANVLFSKGFKEVEPLLNRDYDFILISGSYNPIGWERIKGRQIYWNYLTKPSREKILKKVKEGSGLIYIYPLKLSGKIEELYRSSHPIKRNHYILLGIPPLPSLNSNKIKVAKYGKGRVLFLEYPGQCLTPFLRTPPEGNYYDYFYSFLGKSILWVSNKEPDVIFSSLSYFSKELKGEIFNKGESARFWIELNILDKQGKKEGEISCKIFLTQGKNSFSLYINTPLKRGKHFLNLFLKDKGNRIVNWATQEIYVERGVGITGIKLNKKIYKEGEKLQGKVSLINRNKEEKSLSLIISWFDAYGRKMEENIFRINLPSVRKKIAGFTVHISKDYDFSFILKNSLSTYNEVLICLKDGEEIIDEAKEIFFIPHREWDDYKVILWHSTWLPDYLGYHHESKILKEMGVDILDVSPWRITRSQASSILKTGLNLSFVNVNRFHLSLESFKEAEKTLIRKPCLSNPEYQKKLKNKLQECVNRVGKYCPFFYSIGDENSLTSYTRPLDICFSPYCLSNFREWLKREYGNLDNLNKCWETNFSSWDEVKPFTTKEILKRKNMNFSPWADHRSFMDAVYKKTLLLCKNTIEEMDKEARVGECGTEKQATYGGHNWYKKMKVWTVLQPYSQHGNQLEIQRSFSFIPLAGFTGYRNNEIHQYYYWWWGLFNGESGTSFWYTPLLLNPDFTPTVLGSCLRKYVKEELKKGIGKLIISSERLNDGIAIHYSQPSLQVSYILKTILSYDTEREYYANQDGFLKLIEDLGLQYNFVASEQIEKGELLKNRYKLLILPLSRAISEKEAEEIKKFVRKGGVVLADCQTGIFDNHLKLYPKPILDSLFKIKRMKIFPKKANMQLKYKKIICQIGYCDDIVSNISPLGCLSSSPIKLGSFVVADSNEKIPAVIINRYGKGKAIYLNFLSEYSDLRKIFREGKMKEILMDILKEVGIEPKVRIISLRDNNEIPYTEIVFFKKQNHLYLGIIRDPSLVKGINSTKASMEEMLAYSEKVKIKLPSTYYIYDIRKNKYLGYSQSIKTTITPGVALLYGLLPYKIKYLDLKLQNRILKPGEVLHGKVILSPKGDYVVRIECFDQKGNCLEYFCKNIELKKGKGNFSLPLSLNEKPGDYKIRVKEVISGKEKEVSFKVKSN